MEEKNGITITVKQVWKENPCEDLNTTITWRSEHPDEHRMLRSPSYSSI